MAIFQYTLHKELWTWLSENPRRDKFEWLETFYDDKYEENEIAQECFACDYSLKTSGVCHQNCPLIFDNGVGCLGGLLYEWVHAKDLALKRSLALKIANLPVKEGVEWE